jgi:anti-anti-sigma regulatory factor
VLLGTQVYLRALLKRQQLEESSLQYFVNRKDSVTVVTISGSMSEDVSDVLSAILAEISGNPSKYIVLNFAGLSEFSNVQRANLVTFQKGIRDQGCSIVICHLKDDLKKRFLDGGIMRQGEIVKDLISALQFVLVDSKRGVK